MGPFEKYVKVFHPIYQFYTLSVLLYHLPCVMHKKIKYGMREKKKWKI